MKRLAFQGEPGAFSEEAAFAMCGPECTVLPCRTFQSVIAAVQRGTADGAVLPVENSTIGDIHSSLDVLRSASLTVQKHLDLPIHHYLLGVGGASLQGVQRVISHPAAIAQCRLFLDSHPEIVVEEWYDTAGAAREVGAKKDPGLAAIASKRAATRYKLDVLQANVEDTPDNTTRFVLVTL